MGATSGRQFSYDFTRDAEKDDLNWNYYSDLDCETLAYTALPMDDEVDDGEITKIGSYSPYSDECSVTEETEDDYFTSTYVVNECIGGGINGQDASSILMCDDKGVYFNYYTGCTDCSCSMQQYAHYYDEDGEDACHTMVCHSSKKKKHVHLRKNVKLVDKANLPLFFKNGVVIDHGLGDSEGITLEISMYYAIAFVAALVIVGIVRFIYVRSQN